MGECIFIHQRGNFEFHLEPLLEPISRQLFTFAIVNVVGLGIRTPLFAGLSGLLESLFSLLSFLPVTIFTAEFLGNNSALAIAILVVMLWNYFVNRYWTFNDVK